MKNKYVIVRADKAGVFFGKFKKLEGNIVTLKNVRKLWYWKGAAAVEEISIIGTKNPEECKFTVTVEEIQIFNPDQIIPCTENAIKVIKSVKEWKA